MKIDKILVNISLKSDFPCCGVTQCGIMVEATRGMEVLDFWGSWG